MWIQLVSDADDLHSDDHDQSCDSRIPKILGELYAQICGHTNGARTFRTRS